MNNLLNVKITNCLSPQGVDNTAFANNAAVDTQGLTDLLFLIECGALAAAIGSTAATAALKIEEGDTVGGSYTDVTDAALAAAIAGTKDNKLYAIRVNLRKTHKRFMRVNAPTAGNGSGTVSYLSIKAIGIPDIAPKNAADMGLEELVLA